MGCVERAEGIAIDDQNNVVVGIELRIGEERRQALSGLHDRHERLLGKCARVRLPTAGPTCRWRQYRKQRVFAAAAAFGLFFFFPFSELGSMTATTSPRPSAITEAQPTQQQCFLNKVC